MSEKNLQNTATFALLFNLCGFSTSIYNKNSSNSIRWCPGDKLLPPPLGIWPCIYASITHTNQQVLPVLHSEWSGLTNQSWVFVTNDQSQTWETHRSFSTLPPFSLLIFLFEFWHLVKNWQDSNIQFSRFCCSDTHCTMVTMYLKYMKLWLSIVFLCIVGRMSDISVPMNFRKY